MEKIIELRGITKEFDGERVLNAIDLYIRDNEFVTLLGPSGCGKTTTLRIIGGFASPDEGEVYFNGKKINDVPPYKRQVNTVFQKYALFPHLNVYENIAFALRLKKVPEAEISVRVKEMLELVALRGFEKRNVTTLSGGQQQRVAIARAMVTNPSLILADEPTGNLDSLTGAEILRLLFSLSESQSLSLVMVTHSPGAAAVCDRVLTLENGVLVAAQ